MHRSGSQARISNSTWPSRVYIGEGEPAFHHRRAGPSSFYGVPLSELSSIPVSHSNEELSKLIPPPAYRTQYQAKWTPLDPCPRSPKRDSAPRCPISTTTATSLSLSREQTLLVAPTSPRLGGAQLKAWPTEVDQTCCKSMPPYET